MQLNSVARGFLLGVKIYSFVSSVMHVHVLSKHSRGCVGIIQRLWYVSAARPVNVHPY